MSENKAFIESWFLRLGGDPAASMNANVLGTTEDPVVFSLDPAQLGLSWVRITRMLVFIEDTGNFLAGTYGAESTLANGVRVQYTKNGTTYQLDGGEGITSNAAWARACYDSTPHNYGSGNNFLAVRWTHAKASEPILLRRGDTFDVSIRDDLRGLVSHEFFLQGVRP